jgi:hypothetical protein
MSTLKKFQTQTTGSPGLLLMAFALKHDARSKVCLVRPVTIVYMLNDSATQSHLFLLHDPFVSIWYDRCAPINCYGNSKAFDRVK